MKVVSRERFLALVEILPNIEGFRLLSVYVPAGAFVISWMDLFYWWGELKHLLGNSGFSFKGTVDLFVRGRFLMLLECTGVCSHSEYE